MNDRLVTAIGALAALAIVYGLFFGTSGEAPITRPVSNEAGRNGYLALSRWLEQSGVAVVSWRERFDRLLEGDNGIAATGNLMLTTMPYTHGIRERELQALNGWVRNGNTLLVMAALNDSPEWMLQAAANEFLGLLGAVTGLGYQVATTEESGEAFAQTSLGADTSIEFEPIAHPLMADIRRLEGFSDDPTAQWIAYAIAPYNTRPFLRLATDTATNTDAAWEVASGGGRILVFASASLLSNHQIANADNGRLVANVIARFLQPGGAFVFDDMHHGLTTLYDPEAFYSDSRLHATIGFLIAAWLVYLLAASNRMAPVRARQDVPRQADFLSGLGGFMARRLGRRDTGLMMFDDWFGELRRRRGLGASPEPPWQALADTPALGHELLARLRDDYDQLEQGRAVDLVTLHNRILKAREAIG